MYKNIFFVTKLMVRNKTIFLSVAAQYKGCPSCPDFEPLLNIVGLSGRTRWGGDSSQLGGRPFVSRGLGGRAATAK